MSINDSSDFDTTDSEINNLIGMDISIINHVINTTGPIADVNQHNTTNDETIRQHPSAADGHAVHRILDCNYKKMEPAWEDLANSREAECTHDLDTPPCPPKRLELTKTNI